MYAVIITSGKQYKVSENDVLKVDKLEAEVGSIVQFDQVLSIRGAAGELRLGTPVIEGAKISAEVLEQTRDDKIIVFKKKRRHNYRRKNGHRQYITVLRILDVSGKGGTERKAPVKRIVPDVEKTEATEQSTDKKAGKSKANSSKKNSAKK